MRRPLPLSISRQRRDDFRRERRISHARSLEVPSAGFGGCGASIEAHMQGQVPRPIERRQFFLRAHQRTLVRCHRWPDHFLGRHDLVRGPSHHHRAIDARCRALLSLGLQALLEFDRAVYLLRQVLLLLLDARGRLRCAAFLDCEIQLRLGRHELLLLLWRSAHALLALSDGDTTLRLRHLLFLILQLDTRERLLLGGLGFLMCL